jgi:hypothetical protein
LVVRCDPVTQDAWWASTLEGLRSTVVVGERVEETTGYADHVLGVSSHFESEGTFMNRKGRIQHFEAAVSPPGRTVAGWQALAELLAALGGPRYDSVDAVTEMVLRKLTEREGLGREWLGTHGRSVAAWDFRLGDFPHGRWGNLILLESIRQNLIVTDGESLNVRSHYDAIARRMSPDIDASARVAAGTCAMNRMPKPYFMKPAPVGRPARFTQQGT